jgi:hypothetical protein
MPYITPVLGAKLTYGASILSLFSGLTSFNENRYIDSIEIVQEGQNKGKVKIVYAVTPIIYHTVICDPSSISRRGVKKNDPFTEIAVSQGFYASKGTSFDEPMEFFLSTEAWIDHEGLDWILSRKEKSEVNDLFTDLVSERVKKYAKGASLS